MKFVPLSEVESDVGEAAPAKTFKFVPLNAVPATTPTAAENRAHAQASQDEASKGLEQITTPQAELAEAESNVAALRRELTRKGVDVGARPAVGSTRAGDFLLAQAAKTQTQQPADGVTPPAAPPAPAATPALASRAVDDRVRRTPSLYDVNATASKPVGTVAETQASLNMAGISPQYVASIEAQFNQLPPAQRATALRQAMAENPPNTVKGRAVRAVAARNTAWGKVTDPATSYISKAARQLSPRVEDVTQELIDQGVRADIAPGIAANRIALGDANRPMAAVDRDVVGEEAAAAVEQQAKELKDAGFAKRVGAGALSGAKKSFAGLAQFGADLWGDTNFSQELADTQRIEGAKAAAIPQGESIFEKSFQGAATSLATQAPFMALSALTGTSVPVLAQTALQQFGDSYGEGRAAGLSTTQASLRATPMAAAEVFFERFGMTKALAGLKSYVAEHGGANVAKYVAKAIATELPAELATTATQYVTDALPGVGLNKNPSLVDLYRQLEETLRQTVLQAGVTGGVTIAGVTGIQGAKATPQALAAAKERLREASNQIVGIEKTNELLGPRAGAYERPGYEGLAQDYAQARRVPFASTSGTLNVPPVVPSEEFLARQGQKEPELGADSGVPTEYEPPLFATTAEDTEAKVNAIAERLRSRGIPRENALRIAQKQVAEEAGPAPAQLPNEEQAAKGRAAIPDMSKLSAWPDVLLVETLKMQEAQEAPNVLLVEAIQAELQRRAQTQGAKDVAGTESTASGEGASVASQPGVGTPAGPEAPPRDGVVSTEPDAGLPADGKGPESGALTETETPVAEGTPSGTETVEAKQAEPQEQKAPAAPVVKPAKPPKAAKPAKEGKGDVHTVAQGAEGKWSHAINGEIAGTYDTKRQATAASLLEKAKKNGNADLIKERQKIFDEAMNPQQRGRPPKIIPLESTEEVKPEAPKAEKAAPEAPKAEEKPPTVKTPITVTETKTIKGDPLTGPSTKVKLSDGSEYEINRQDTISTAGLPGWHDVNKHIMYSYLGNTKAEAIQELIRRQEEKRQPETPAKATAAKAKPEPNLTAEEKERLVELDDLHHNATNNPNTEGGRAAKKTLERITKDFDEPKVVRERAKAMLAGEYSAPEDNEFWIQAAQGKQDLAFSKFTTSSQTLSHIIKTGTDFQKRLARRLRSTVRNVKMVVVEKGQELPASVAAVKDKWNRALALYNTNEKVVYTKGESYGENNGLNAVVQLHELLHGATSQKVRTALAYMQMGRHLDSQMVTAVKGLQKIMDAARAELNKQIEAGTVDPDVHNLAVYGEAFTNLHEFVSYGNTDAKLQEFLQGVKGFEKNSNLFSPFVDALRRVIGMGKEDATALSDLIQHTDQLISSRRPGGWGFPEVGVLASAIPRTQEEMDADSDAAWSKVTRSQLGQQRAAALSSVMALRDPRVIWARLGSVWDKLDGPTRKAIAITFDRNGIASTIGKHIPALVDIADRLQKMDGMAASLRAQAAKQAGMIVNFARKDRKAMKVLDRLIPASTLARYDPANPPANGVRDARTDAAYESLGDAGQRVYREVRDYFADMHRVARDIMEANVDGLDLPSDTKQKLMGSIRLAFEEGKIEPYFPLMRFGDFIFRIKERGSAEYESFRFETKAERDFAAKAYAKEQGIPLDDLIEDNEVDLAEDDGGKELRGVVEGTSTLLKELYGAIDSMDLSDPSAKAKLKDNMYQVYLDLMPEASVRKQFIRREEVTGFGTDTLRMINASGIKIASALSKLQYGNEIRNLSEQAHRQLKGKEQYKAFVGAMDAIADEALSPAPLGPVAAFFDPAAKQWTKFTFYHNLTSLSSALMQPADIMLAGVPVLVGNHGPKAMVELTKMANVVKQFGVWETLPDGTKRFRAPSIAYAKGLPQIELDAISDMVNEYGLSTDTLANEIFDAATQPVNKADPKAVELAKNAGKLLVLGGLMHHTERLSREVLGAASFRLYYAEMEKASPGNPSNYANAVRAAVAEVNEALGDYSPGNRPQIMRGPIGKLASTYKFFPLTRIKLLGGNFFRMIPFLNKEGKIAAATKFFGILGTHGLFTGVVGLPMYGIIQALWGQWQKDDDAPQTMKDLDHDTWWRTEFLRKELDDSELTKFVKDVAKGGVLNYATGMAISERLGLNDMVFRTPDPAKNLNEAVTNYATAFFGATLTPIKEMQNSWDYYSQGEYQKAFEALPFTPKSIGALSAAERVSSEGIESKKGVPILDKGEATTKELIGQAFGFQSARVAEARRIAHATDVIERGISSEKQAVVGKAATMFLKAINPNRSPEQRQRFLDMYLETIQKVPKFNVKYPEHGIDGKEIDAKIDAELEAIAESKVFGGVKISDNNVRLFIQAALASREALNNPK